jgi:hypothetical protein
MLLSIHSQQDGEDDQGQRDQDDCSPKIAVPLVIIHLRLPVPSSHHVACTTRPHGIVSPAIASLKPSPHGCPARRALPARPFCAVPAGTDATESIRETPIGFDVPQTPKRRCRDPPHQQETQPPLRRHATTPPQDDPQIDGERAPSILFGCTCLRTLHAATMVTSHG